MRSSYSGSIRLFRFSGIQVYLHWSWLLVAVYQISSRPRAYSSLVWNVAEYLALFVIVLLHEFGHAFASRQVGGESKEILLWPFGGIAFVKVPPRPGAELWSIAAGPLVNVILCPIFGAILWAMLPAGTSELLWSPNWLFRFGSSLPDIPQFAAAIYRINLWVVMFNVLPIYPLDGGQILRSLLWFGLGRVRSLQVAAIIGFAGIAGILVVAVLWQSIFMGAMALFLAQQCLLGWKHAQALKARLALPRHPDFACPACKEAPPGGPMWLCGNCGQRFDPFSTGAVCPHCSAVQTSTPCAYCGTAHPIAEWVAGAPRPGRTPVIDV